MTDSVRWVRLCGVAEAPRTGEVTECEAMGIAVCLANLNGELAALDNWCPHRRGPLGQGWIEGAAVVCPWHAWAFDAKSGLAEFPEGERVAVFPVRVDGESVMIEISPAEEQLGEV